MVSHIAGTLVLTGTIMFGVMSAMPAHATPSTAAVPRVISAPELEPMALAGGIAILIGGVIALNERRRKPC
jgi:hypothetical protein